MTDELQRTCCSKSLKWREENNGSLEDFTRNLEDTIKIIYNMITDKILDRTGEKGKH